MGAFVERNVRKDEVDSYIASGWCEVGGSVYPNMILIRIPVDSPVEAPVKAPVVGLKGKK